MAENNHIETRVAIVEKELGTVYAIFQRFETTLEKITEVSSSLKELIAVHDNRLMEREKADLTIFEVIEKRKEEYSRGVERMHQKMEDLSGELRREIRSELNEQYEDLKEAVQRFEISQKEIAAGINKTIEQHVGTRDKKFSEVDSDNEKLDARIKTLENWRWAILGAGAVIGFIVGKWSMISGIFTG